MVFQKRWYAVSALLAVLLLITVLNYSEKPQTIVESIKQSLQLNPVLNVKIARKDRDIGDNVMVSDQPDVKTDKTYDNESKQPTNGLESSDKIIEESD